MSTTIHVNSLTGTKVEIKEGNKLGISVLLDANLGLSGPPAVEVNMHASSSLKKECKRKQIEGLQYVVCQRCKRILWREKKKKSFVQELPHAFANRPDSCITVYVPSR